MYMFMLITLLSNMITQGYESHNENNSQGKFMIHRQLDSIQVEVLLLRPDSLLTLKMQGNKF